MVHVRLGGTLKSAAGGRGEFEVEAATIRELLQRLAEQEPHLRPFIEKGVSVAIDGTIYREAHLTAIPEGAEVFILPQLVGG